VFERGNWKEAVGLNEEILKLDDKNHEALNRLSRAYLELGKYTKAVTHYKKVLKLDPYNAIAQKALERIKNLKKASLKDLKNGDSFSAPAANLFIEEPGKTKSVTLIHLGEPGVISTLDAGESVVLECHAHRVSVMTTNGRYIGRMPDDISRTIIKLKKDGNEYVSFIRSVLPDQVRIFIKETKRSELRRDLPSFPLTERPTYVTFTPPDLIHDERPDVSTTEEIE
jgi:tetratricopeptide (TPR) repeat protein